MSGLTVACVLRSGGDFDPQWVRALQVGVSEYLPPPHRFVCLSDVPVPCERVSLEHSWPGWWAKMEAFGLPAEYGRVLYLDLDTLPVGDMSGLAAIRAPLALIRDLNPRIPHLQTGVMAFSAGPSSYAAMLYAAFRERAGDNLKGYHSHARWVEAYADAPDVIQDLAPGAVVSYKLDCRDAKPEGPALVCGHGQPRFSDPAAGWAHELWRKRAA